MVARGRFGGKWMARGRFVCHLYFTFSSNGKAANKAFPCYYPCRYYIILKHRAPKYLLINCSILPFVV